MTPGEFAAAAGVSRETLARLEAHADLLVRWQQSLNLVSAATLPDLWRRHFLDSAQIAPLLPDNATGLLDIGSGAGFPGLVLATMGVPNVHLVDSDHRKCAFLREAARAAGTTVTVHAARIEALEPWPVPVVTARGCAPLDRLLGWAAPFLAPDGICLFLKGRQVEQELTVARKAWTIDCDLIPSRTDPAGVVLRVKGLAGGRRG